MTAASVIPLSIAGIRIQLESDRKLAVTSAFEPFVCTEQDAQYKAIFHQVAELPPVDADPIYTDHCYRIHPDGKGGYLRSFFDAPRDLTPYAMVSSEFRDGQIDIPYLEKGGKCVSELENSFFHLDLEGIMVRENRVCLHAACVSTPMGGILFSGPSGIGKSTQADLWRRYRGSKLINGDRPILSLDDEILAWGSPYAGSSKCYVNESCPAAAIILLQQAPRCSVRRLGLSEAFRGIYSGMTVHSWDSGFVAKACDMAMRLAAEVPVYEFRCTPDETAVDYLEKALKEGVANE